MKKQNRIAVKDPDIFDILSATWIFASNDDNEIITYKGVKYRLNLSDEYDLKTLIKSRGELFRRGVPNHRLKEWQQEMLSGHHVPLWILEIEDSTARRQEIEAITSDEVFRSQFRSERDAPRSDLKMIDWGLQHIDRLRKANLDAYGQMATRRQMWIVFDIGIINIILTIIVALLNYYK